MARQITKEHAKKIAKKLEAQWFRDKKHHKVMGVFHDDRLVASFGIRHGSEKDQGHDHVPKDLYVDMIFAKGLALCPRSRADWIDLMREQGRL